MSVYTATSPLVATGTTNVPASLATRSVSLPVRVIRFEFYQTPSTATATYFYRIQRYAGTTNLSGANSLTPTPTRDVSSPATAVCRYGVYNGGAFSDPSFTGGTSAVIRYQQISAAEYAFPHDIVLNPGSGMLLDFYVSSSGVYGRTYNMLAAVTFEELYGSASG